ncbi:MAG: 4Fe-4S binding protein [Actinobacteria bacterium]|nr:4Fe-4S binding protein [Actinomycetota bacterium]
MRESTRRLFRLHGWRIDRALHGYVYYRWIDRYIKTLMAIARRYVRLFPRGRFIFDFFFNRYHCKVLTEEQAAKILTLDHDVIMDPELSARVVPFPHAHRIILDQPQHIVAMDCACRIEKGVADPEALNVCLAVGEPVASFWLEHGAERLHARRVSATEALEILHRERERGSVPTAWFKDAAGDRFFAICNCPPSYCDALESARLARALRVESPPVIAAPSGYLAVIDRAACAGCGACVEACPFGALSLDGEEKALVSFDLCMGCGLCAERCEWGVPSLTRDERKGIPLDIDELALLRR